MSDSIISMSANISPAGGGSDDGLIKQGDTSGFMRDVIEESRKQPVIVDFWAPWCGPCKQLGPAIEKVVRDAGGTVKLVKINIDENQALAGQMRIQSIPAVFAFVNGQPVDGFLGALPESEIRAFVERIAGPLDGKDDRTAAVLEQADAALEAGDYAAASEAYAQVLSQDKESPAALAGLAKCHIRAGNLEAAEATLALVPKDKESASQVTSARAELDLAAASSSLDDEAIAALRDTLAGNPDDHRARFDLATALNAAGQREAALEELLDLFRRDRAWNDEAARKQLLTFFDAWGAGDPLTVAGRRKLSAIMFS